MDLKTIKQLVKLMMDGELRELDITDGDSRVHLKRGMGEAPLVVSAPAAAAHQAGPAPAQVAPAPAAAAPAEPAEKLLEIKSPMVGTFYSSPSPDADPYVSNGAKVGPDAVVCIIEAMKVMNEIKAECSGTIAEVCVTNAQPVEFGQVLFRVRPA